MVVSRYRNFKLVAQCGSRSLAVGGGDGATDFDFGGGNHLNINPRLGEGFEHLGGYARSSDRACADDANFGNIVRYEDAIVSGGKIVV